MITPGGRAPSRGRSGRGRGWPRAGLQGGRRVPRFRGRRTDGRGDLIDLRDRLACVSACRSASRRRPPPPSSPRGLFFERARPGHLLGRRHPDLRRRRERRARAQIDVFDRSAFGAGLQLGHFVPRTMSPLRTWLIRSVYFDVVEG